MPPLRKLFSLTLFFLTDFRFSWIGLVACGWDFIGSFDRVIPKPWSPELFKSVQVTTLQSIHCFSCMTEFEGQGWGEVYVYGCVQWLPIFFILQTQNELSELGGWKDVLSPGLIITLKTLTLFYSFSAHPVLYSNAIAVIRVLGLYPYSSPQCCMVWG